MKHLTRASHPYLQRETTKKWRYLQKASTIAVRTHLTISFFSNNLIPMDIQHSDIGCKKHQTIPAFQPVHPTQL